MTTFKRLFVSIGMSVLLAACGGGGGSAGATAGSAQAGGGGTTGSTTGATPVAATPVPATLEIFASAAQLSSARTSSVTFTVVAKDAANRAMPNQPVEFSASSGNLVGAVPAPTTGSAGEAITSVSLSPGVDASNRDIVVTVSSAGTARSITLPVTGTNLAIAGASSVLSGGVIGLTVKATDSGGRAIAGTALTVTSALGNPVASSTGFVTNSLGVASFTYTGSSAGLDRLTVSGLGVTSTASVSVSSEDFGFVLPSSGSVVAVSAAQSVRVRLLAGTTPQAGVAIAFSTTRGGVSAASATTDASGEAAITVASTTAGPATITARTASGAQVTLPLTFVASTPASLTLQASPSAVPPNPAGTQNHQSTLQAVVRDASGNPVAGRTVNFTAVEDRSGGTISPGSGVTDAFGTVSTQFIAGGITTGSNGVVISATVAGTGVTNQAALTVSGQALFITIGVGNEISNYDTDTYQQQFAVYVVDANGTPVANQDVQFSALPTQYGKGSLTFANGRWNLSADSLSCLNEDRNLNGILDLDEDVNGNGRLTPGLPVAVAPGTVRTNQDGFATFYLRYGEDKVPWVAVNIVGRALVAGTESSGAMLFSLVGSASDFTNEKVPPAGVISPYGTATDCAVAQ